MVSELIWEAGVGLCGKPHHNAMMTPFLLPLTFSFLEPWCFLSTCPYPRNKPEGTERTEITRATPHQVFDRGFSGRDQRHVSQNWGFQDSFVLVLPKHLARGGAARLARVETDMNTGMEKVHLLLASPSSTVGRTVCSNDSFEIISLPSACLAWHVLGSSPARLLRRRMHHQKPPPTETRWGKTMHPRQI